MSTAPRSSVTLAVIVPALMTFLTLVLRGNVARWTNVALGAVYTAVNISNLIGETWAYYLLFGCIEVVLSVLIVWYAWRWRPHGGGPAARSSVPGGIA